MHGARRRGDYGGVARQKSGTPGGVGSPGPSKPTTFEELNRLLDPNELKTFVEHHREFTWSDRPGGKKGFLISWAWT